MESTPVARPSAEGVNRSAILQLAAGESSVVATQSPPSREKLAPASDIAVSCNGAFPVLLTVTVRGSEKNGSVTVPKSMLWADTEAAGAATPVPDSETVLCPPGPL